MSGHGLRWEAHGARGSCVMRVARVESDQLVSADVPRRKKADPSIWQPARRKVAALEPKAVDAGSEHVDARRLWIELLSAPVVRPHTGQMVAQIFQREVVLCRRVLRTAVRCGAVRASRA
eukprot:scaffold109408_cov72-Phaeocystis_antarctica.AAC.2